MTTFIEENLTAEESFWVMFYFLKDHYDTSFGQFDVSDILSASEPYDWSGNNQKVPADHNMIWYWNKAIKKFKEEGIPPFKELK